MTFRQLMDEICYDWDTHYTLTKTTDNSFVVNKLLIEPNYVTYKTECRELASGVFEQVEAFYNLLED